MDTTSVTAIPSGSVVVGVDGSDHAEQAVAWAARQADLTGRPLVLLHAVDPTSTANGLWLSGAGIDLVQLQHEIEAAAQVLLERTAAEVRAAHPDLETHPVTRLRDPRQALLEAATGASLVVVGSRGRGPVASLLLGSVSATVVKHATSPTVVVRPVEGGRTRHGVLVGVDCTSPAPGVLEAAYAQASLREVPLTVLHCFWDVLGTAHASRRVPADDTTVDDLRMLLAETVSGMSERYPDVEVHQELARGFAEELLSRESETHDLVVVGHHPASGMRTFLHGSIALAVVEMASCPVLVVPLAPRDDTAPR